MLNYIANFAKAETHDYAGFFSSYEQNSDLDKIKKEIICLSKLLEAKNSEYSAALSCRYNSTFTPLGVSHVLVYHGKNGNYYYDGESGVEITREESHNKYFTNLPTKSGHFEIVVGYAYELGAAIVRSYKYTIAANCNSVSLKTLAEKVVPLVDNSPMFVSYFDATKGSFMTPEPSIVCNCDFKTLDSIKATKFLNAFYGMEKSFDFITLADVRNYSIKNASFEVIIRTCEDQSLMECLLEMHVSDSKPIYAILGTTKADWNYAIENGCSVRFAKYKMVSALKSSEYNNERVKSLGKTDKDWIDFMVKCQTWEEELDFYRIQYDVDLFATLIMGYCGLTYNYNCRIFSTYYPFGKWCAYVITEAINQGYTSVKNFIKMLGDYICMCQDMEVTPTLYSSYLQQTHDIMNRNHNIKVTQEQEKIFATRYENFKPWDDNNYTVIAPTTITDIQKEGDALNHCVGSYIKRVINGETRIVFLRKLDEISKSLITVEIKDNKIIQARGLHNRDLNNSEHQALVKYAASNKLLVKV